MESPINYFGGKSYLAEKILEFFPYEYKTYVEGFGGGASVLLNKNITPLEIYNDIEENVYSLFKVISNSETYKQLQQKLYLTPYSNQLRSEYKELLNTNLSLLDRAYYFFYVCRTSFNGNGGFSFNPLIRRGCSKSISAYLSAIDNLEVIYERICHCVIEKRDIFELINKYDKEDTFFYLDPPYVQDTRTSNIKYKVDFDNEQHKKLVDRLLNIKGKVLISGYDSPIYDKLVENGWNKTIVKGNVTLAQSDEVLWYNYNIEKNTLW